MPKIKNKSGLLGGQLIPLNPIQPTQDQLRQNAIDLYQGLERENKETELPLEEFIAFYISENAQLPKTDELYGNNIYMVIVDRNTDLAYEDMTGHITHISIKRKDKRPCNDWRDFQEIKNFVCGPDREAIQLYPSEDRVVDTSNQYHLWVLPEGARFTLGWNTRTVVTEDINPTKGGVGQNYRGNTNQQKRGSK